MRRFALDPLGVGLLSLRQLYRRLPEWIEVNVYGLLLSLPVVTLPAAQAGLYYAVREGLLDHLDGANTPRAAFFAGFRRHFGRSAMALLIDLAIGAIIGYSFVFWVSAQIPALNYLAVVSIYFGIFWLMCQPFLFPALVERPELPPLAVLKWTVRLVLSRPVYALLTALLVGLFAFIGIVLLGPVLLALGALIALVSIQATWVMLDKELSQEKP